MRRLMIVGNWKMNKDFGESDDFFDELSETLNADEDRYSELEVVVCPPSVYLEMATDLADESSFSIGAQDVSEHLQGAYTGEISALMLRSLEVAYAIVGHSERRKYHLETNQQVNRKVNIVQQHQITPIMCIGETEVERNNRKTETVLEKQIREGLENIPYDNAHDLVVAYEPVWAIGTGKTATPDMAQDTHRFIREELRKKYGDAADDIRILYGGSVKPGNIKILLSQEDIDGALIGGASLKIDDYKSMINTATDISK
ncbi:MAG: triose-phosphate isomerase [Candidatus Cloacimonetes bacterium]|nr:triose-phosphate isomerase [Candidatus Cloacimonadota bacterium]